MIDKFCSSIALFLLLLVQLGWIDVATENLDIVICKLIRVIWSESMLLSLGQFVLSNDFLFRVLYVITSFFVSVILDQLAKVLFFFIKI